MIDAIIMLILVIIVSVLMFRYILKWFAYLPDAWPGPDPVRCPHCSRVIEIEIRLCPYCYEFIDWGEWNGVS